MGDRFDTVLRFPGPSARANVQTDIPGGPIMTDLLPPQTGHMPTGNPKADAKAAKAYAKATRPWFKKKRWWLAGAVIVVIGASATSGGGTGDETASNNSSSQSSNAGKTHKAVSNGKAQPAQESGPVETVSQENARESAESYLDLTAYSRSGLIDQLKFEGYSIKDATYGVDSLHANWNEQAAESAQDYLDMTSYSRTGLIGQLKFEGYTQAQAVYGVNQAGL